MRTGSCKFAATCKFNHPQPPMVRGLVALPGSSVYSNGSSTTPSAHPFQGMPSWGMPRSPYVPRSRFQGPSAFASVVVQPQNIVSMPGWNGAYPTRMGPQQPVLGSTSFVYGASSINEGSSSSIPSAYTPYVPGSANSGLPQALQAGFTAGDFPERPGEQVCQYYIKTGDCKFGMSCRYHHPKDRASLIPVCNLSPLGLPIRQGAAQCTFYMQYGTCKFGSTCKFDHPITMEKILIYSPSSSSLMDQPVAPSPVALPVATPMPPSDSVDHGTIMFHTRQRSASGTEKKQGYKEAYPGDSAGEGSTQQSNYKSSSSVGSNGSVSNTETAEVRGESKDTSSVPL
ncbi:hypothetical protein KP509_16G071600 [Ceratopteris richardii]|nr:hypothetical protein KP509_16G071600 [Ceratopteris richardii]